MKILLTISALILSLKVSSQISSNGYPEVHIFNNASYTIRLEVIAKTKFKYIIDDKATESESDTVIVIINNEYKTFHKAFGKVIGSKKYISLTDSVSPSDQMKELDRIYYFFQAAEILGPSLYFKPKAGEICLDPTFNIERITSSDYHIMGKAKEKKNVIRKNLKSNGQLKRRGVFRKKIFDYQQNSYTKKELKKRIFNDLVDSMIMENRKKFYLEVLPNYLKFISELKLDRDNYKHKEIANTELDSGLVELKNHADSESIEKDKSITTYFHEARAFNDLARENDLPTVPRLFNMGLDRVISQQIRSNRIASGEHQRYIYETEKTILEINKKLTEKKPKNIDSLKMELDEKTDLVKEMSQKKRILDSLHLPLRRLSALAEKCIADSLSHANAETDFLIMKNFVNQRKEELNKKRVALDLKLISQNNSLKKLQDAFKDITMIPFQIDWVDLEFNEGFIENILAVGKVAPTKVKYFDHDLQEKEAVIGVTSDPIKFENRYPIGFSRKRDFENLKDKHLFTIDRNFPKYRLRLEELLSIYFQQHELNRRDFSPADSLLHVAFDTPQTSKYCHTLYKEATYKLFEAKVFSDFVGLDRTNPNGLIQTEIDKKISLITNRFPGKLFKYETWNFGFLSYITPTITLSKIEDNNKELSLRYKNEEVNGVYLPKRYTSTLELKRHENFKIGWDLNLVLLDIPTFKSTFYLDYGFRYGRVAIVDSLRDYDATEKKATLNGKAITYGVNTVQFYPRINWQLRSDERYSFNFSASANWYFLLSNAFTQVGNQQVFADFGESGNGNRVYGNVCMLATLKPGPGAKGRLFFRYQYNWQFNYGNTGFHQAQVGYSFFLLSNRK